MEYLLVTEIKEMEGTGEVEDRCGQEFFAKACALKHSESCVSIEQDFEDEWANAKTLTCRHFRGFALKNGVPYSKCGR